MYLKIGWNLKHVETNWLDWRICKFYANLPSVFPAPQSTVQNPVCVPLRNPAPHPRDLAVSEGRKFLGEPINSTSMGWRCLIHLTQNEDHKCPEWWRVSWRKHIEMNLKAQGAEVSLEISQSIVELHRASPSKAFAWVLIGWIFCYHGMRDQADFPEDFQDHNFSMTFGLLVLCEVSGQRSKTHIIASN